jgi:hypothetical protein
MLPPDENVRGIVFLIVDARENIKRAISTRLATP